MYFSKRIFQLGQKEPLETVITTHAWIVYFAADVLDEESKRGERCVTSKKTAAKETNVWVVVVEKNEQLT